jgi:hypothetical protein
MTKDTYYQLLTRKTAGQCSDPTRNSRISIENGSHFASH